MADIVDPATRSRMMSAVRTRDTAPEVRVRRALHRSGLRFRLHDSQLPGRPDIVLRKYCAVVLVHGCFWHSHEGCRKAYLPTSNRPFWEKKIGRNVQRDQEVTSRLAEMGWRVFVVWECESRDQKRLDGLVRLIRCRPVKHWGTNAGA